MSIVSTENVILDCSVCPSSSEVEVGLEAGELVEFGSLTRYCQLQASDLSGPSRRRRLSRSPGRGTKRVDGVESPAPQSREYADLSKNRKQLEYYI